MTDDGRIAELERFLAERGQGLMRTSVLLTRTREEGEDLLQTALERLLRNWRHVDGNPEGYLRRTMYNLAADGWRRQATWRRKLAVLRTADDAAAPDIAARLELRDALVRLLLQLPPRQRAVLVLRYWEQASQAEIAEILGCSEGTVKSAASRGLQRMRDLAVSWQERQMLMEEERS